MYVKSLYLSVVKKMSNTIPFNEHHDIAQRMNEIWALPVNQWPGWALLFNLLLRANNNMQIIEEDGRIIQLEGTHQEWLQRIEALLLASLPVQEPEQVVTQE